MVSTRQSIYKALSPVGEIGIKLDRLVPSLATLEGKTIGILDNSKECHKMFLDIMKERLEQRITKIRVMRYGKTRSTSVEPELLKKIAQECDGVIHGIGD